MLDMLHREHANPDGKNKRKPMKWILVDSFVIAMIAVCAAMPADIPTLTELWVMLKAFIGALFFQIAIERGIKRGE